MNSAGKKTAVGAALFRILEMVERQEVYRQGAALPEIWSNAAEQCRMEMNSQMNKANKKTQKAAEVAAGKSPGRSN